MHYWFFGLPGSGKSHMANLFSAMTGFPQYEGDDFHTHEDRRVIAEGQFTLAHRHAQLKRISDVLHSAEVLDAVITHPLPDRNSRAGLYTRSSKLIYVKADLALIKQRLTSRTGHHFGADQLDEWIPRHWEKPIGEENHIIQNN